MLRDVETDARHGDLQRGRAGAWSCGLGEAGQPFGALQITAAKGDVGQVRQQHLLKLQAPPQTGCGQGFIEVTVGRLEVAVLRGEHAALVEQSRPLHVALSTRVDGRAKQTA